MPPSSSHVHDVGRCRVEIIGFSGEDAAAIEAAGGDRVELCSAFALGGLTPSPGTVREAKAGASVPIMAMLRPRESGMTYTEAEFDAMRRDLAALLEAGADGIVLYVTNPDGTPDEDRLPLLAKDVKSAGRLLTAHRAFDLAPDPFAALETLVALGFDRVLTSGGEPTAIAGEARITDLVRAARDRIQILPGGGIRPNNVRTFVARTGVAEVHLSALRRVPDPSLAATDLRFGAHDTADYPAVDPAVIRAMRDALGSST